MSSYFCRLESAFIIVWKDYFFGGFFAFPYVYVYWYMCIYELYVYLYGLMGRIVAFNEPIRSTGTAVC